jgi:UDP-N-acetylmuramate--alanine ligase
LDRFDFSQIPAGASIHFIGIGGISMSGLARLMITRGYKVTGSDWSCSDITKQLEADGASVYYGHGRSDYIDGAQLVVRTAAAHSDNPEVQRAEELGKRCIDRAEFLGAVMRGYKSSVGVAGTHGKTTTTSMLAHALIYAQKDPTISVGGMLDLIGGNFRVGGSEFFVTEACEYTNSFLKFYPKIALITNIEEDHLDFFSGIDEIIASFRKYAELTSLTDGGAVVAWGNDANIRRALDGSGLSVVYYSMDKKGIDGADCEFWADNITRTGGFPKFDVMRRDEKLCTITLKVPGDHNILNALAVIAVCSLIGIDAQTAARGIEQFKGTHRRFERKGSFGDSAVIDDYAHHPTEIKATLKAANSFDHNKIWCVFQPHTYTRTKTLWKEFCEAFDGADELILADIYPAREEFDGVTRSEDLAADIAKRGVKARFFGSFDEIADTLRAEVREGDIVLTVGAGDVYKIGEMLVK